MPVNEPGPTVTANRSTAASVVSPSAATSRSMGTRVSACRPLDSIRLWAITSPPAQSAAEQAVVAVSNPSSVKPSVAMNRLPLRLRPRRL